jgi:hypothetical protein
MSLPGMTCFVHALPRPERQSAHVPHGITAGTITSRPIHSRNDSPAASTTPLTS